MCQTKKRKCCRRIPCSYCTSLGIGAQCVVALTKQRGPRRRILEEETRLDVNGGITDVLLPPKHQLVLSLMVSYADGALLQKNPRETAQAFGIELLQDYVIFLVMDAIGGKLRKVAEEGVTWLRSSADTEREFARLIAEKPIKNQAHIRRCRVEWFLQEPAEMNVFFDRDGLAQWLIIHKKQSIELLSRKKPSLQEASEMEDMAELPPRTEVEICTQLVEDSFFF